MELKGKYEKLNFYKQEKAIYNLIFYFKIQKSEKKNKKQDINNDSKLKIMTI